MKLALYPNTSPAFVGGYMAALFGEPANSNPFPYQETAENADSRWHWEVGHKQATADIANNATLSLGATPTGQITLQVLVPEDGWHDAFLANYPNPCWPTAENCLRDVRRIKEIMTDEFGNHCRIIQHLIRVIE